MCARLPSGRAICARKSRQTGAALARKYGPDELLRIMDEVLDYSETMMRAALRLLPDGEASFADVFDGDGVIAPGAQAMNPSRSD